MATPTYLEAIDEINGLFFSAWEANSPAINGGTAPEVHWEGDLTFRPDPDEPWVGHQLINTGSRQRTLQVAGMRCFERTGIVNITVSVPYTKGGINKARALAVVARDAYEGIYTTTGIAFYSVRIVELGDLRNTWYQLSIVAEFEYDERR